MKYVHSFLVSAPLGVVAAFHQDLSSMAAITPPPVIVRFQKLPARMQEGVEIHFTLWFGLLPVRWVACIDEVESDGFCDRQVKGPFRLWIHRHTFLPVGSAGTQVRDEVEVQLKRHLFWGIFGLAMWLSLPVLFRFRAWKTRRILSQREATKNDIE